MAMAMKSFHSLQTSVVKMNKPFISLCPEITREHALKLMDWLEDEHVTCYLSDSRHTSRFIEQAIDRTQLPILTHLFNRGGRFFMAYDRHDAPVGFVRLIKSGVNCEIVLVIGDSDKWVSISVENFPGVSVQKFPVGQLFFTAFFRCLKRNESLPVSRMSQW